MPPKAPKAKAQNHDLLPLVLAAFRSWAAHKLPAPSLSTMILFRFIVSIPFQLVLLVVMAYVSTYLSGMFLGICYIICFGIAFLNYGRITKRLRAAAGPIAVFLLLALFIVPHLPSFPLADLFRLWLNQSSNR